MLQESKAFSGFSVRDITEAKQFYETILGLTVKDTGMGLELHLGADLAVFIYQKENHVPAEFTILNFPTDDINATIDQLVAKGVVFERYEGLPAPQDERGVLRGKAAGEGPDIAWFKDPSGNILSVLTN